MTEQQVVKMMNALKRSLAMTARTAHDAVSDDGRIDMMEGSELAMQGMNTAMQVIGYITKLDKDDLGTFLRVLEKMEFMLPENHFEGL